MKSTGRISLLDQKKINSYRDIFLVIKVVMQRVFRLLFPQDMYSDIPEQKTHVHELLARVLEDEKIRKSDHTELASVLLRQTVLIENEQGLLVFPTPLHSRYWGSAMRVHRA